MRFWSYTVVWVSEGWDSPPPPPRAKIHRHSGLQAAEKVKDYIHPVDSGAKSKELTGFLCTKEMEAALRNYRNKCAAAQDRVTEELKRLAEKLEVCSLRPHWDIAYSLNTSMANILSPVTAEELGASKSLELPCDQMPHCRSISIFQLPSSHLGCQRILASCCLALSCKNR